MKPTKNNVYCVNACRPKMLFETEAKALRFIKFNADSIETNKPVRAYYCQACGGWHVTHREHWSGDENNDKIAANIERVTGHIARKQCKFNGRTRKV